MKELLASLLTQLAEFQASFEVEIANAHAAGFAEGVASVSVGEKIYSQEEMDAALLPLNAKIDELNVAMSSLSLEVDAKILSEVSKVKADLLAAYEASQVAESVVETGFKELLK